jgi:hypothetical protein
MSTEQQRKPDDPKQPIEPKHLADEATGKQEPSANPERAPQHTPGFEAKQKAEADKAKPDDKGGNKDDKPDHGSKPRTHLARAKQHVRRMAPKPTRRHK